MDSMTLFCCSDESQADSVSLFDPSKPPIFDSEFEGEFDPNKPPIYDEENKATFSSPNEDMKRHSGQIVNNGFDEVVEGQIWSGSVSACGGIAMDSWWYKSGCVGHNLLGHVCWSDWVLKRKARWSLLACENECLTLLMEQTTVWASRSEGGIGHILFVFGNKGRHKTRKKRYKDNDQSRVFDPGGCGPHVVTIASKKQRIAF